MVWWRFKSQAPCVWRFGYMTDVSGGLVRMGYWHGDASRGPVVDPTEIETREYRS